MSVHCFMFDVEWDVDEGDDAPSEHFDAMVDVPDDIYNNDNEELLTDHLSDWLSDEFGFCHNGFLYDEC